MIYLRMRVKNGKREVLSMPLIAINLREHYAIAKSGEQFYLYKLDMEKLVPISENTAAVYLIKHVIPPPRL